MHVVATVVYTIVAVTVTIVLAAWVLAAVLVLGGDAVH